MENYRKGKNVEDRLEKQQIPISNLPESFLWMQVRGGSKIRNLLAHAIDQFPLQKTVVWSGFGPSVGKTITCVEIMKREFNQELHQITKLCYKMVDEYWDPLLPELDQLVVKRKLPMIHICLSVNKIKENELGYQPPGKIIPFKGVKKENSSNRRPNEYSRDKH
ncbi:ribonuclease P protein subunit p25-like protein [Anthonomus grandis grandis]|uniref:ribonuclease P protein subunit p25-like protein n=1 Tax=Anthonomus grandis grandis TaxID=2921223 RepID=UPI0021665C72|nr:ribonuclease P protein subunit p25-like protein [Anthonomus grandis grandis]